MSIKYILNINNKTNYNNVFAVFDCSLKSDYLLSESVLSKDKRYGNLNGSI